MFLLPGREKGKNTTTNFAVNHGYFLYDIINRDYRVGFFILNHKNQGFGAK